MVDSDLVLVKKIIRRKAKRIKRASDKLYILRYDIERFNIDETIKKILLNQVDDILPYLENDDKEENQYNFDNANPRR